MDLLRKSGESNLQYHKRLVYGKLVDKTLADADYSELAELIYGKPYSSDVARRMLYGSRLTLEAIDKNNFDNVTDDSIISELETKRLELQKERCRLADQRREYNKCIATDARFEHLCDVVKACADQMQSAGRMVDSDTVNDIYFSDAEAVVVFSDWHVGMVTNNVFNTYNIDICKQRVNHVVSEVIQRIRLHGCKKLHVAVLGDLIHGNCHVSARVASEEVAIEQLMHATELLAQAIGTMSQYVEETLVYVTYGNHARAVQNKHDSIHRDNLERVSEWWLKERFASVENVTIVSSDAHEFLFINACGHDICASHGDIDSVKSSPRLLATLFDRKYGTNIEYILLGDKHHRESFEELGITSTICGSLCGADDYANEKRLYSEPSQLLLIVTPDNGVDAEYRIKC